MQKTIYIEQEVKNHPRVKEFLKNEHRRIIEVEKYSEVFNRKNQDFRVQKEYGPSFIFAKKHHHFILPVPECNSLRTPHNFYFSHVYNCPYDCEYCYLQGMYRSAHFVWFVNYEDFEDEIRNTIKNSFSLQKSDITFFSGYDGDSLALENITGFAKHFIPFMEQFKNVHMELRTKSANIQNLLKIKTPKNTFVTWTLSPQEITKKHEKKTASLSARLNAMQQLQEKNWRICIRVEPFLHFSGWREAYLELFENIKTKLDPQKIEAISFGHLRFPKDTYKTMKKILPQSKLLAKFFCTKNAGEMSYPNDVEQEMTEFFLSNVTKFFPKEKVHWYKGGEGMSAKV